MDWLEDGDRLRSRRIDDLRLVLAIVRRAEDDLYLPKKNVNNSLSWFLGCGFYPFSLAWLQFHYGVSQTKLIRKHATRIRELINS